MEFSTQQEWQVSPHDEVKNKPKVVVRPPTYTINDKYSTHNINSHNKAPCYLFKVGLKIDFQSLCTDSAILPPPPIISFLLWAQFIPLF